MKKMRVGRERGRRDREWVKREESGARENELELSVRKREGLEWGERGVSGAREKKRESGTRERMRKRQERVGQRVQKEREWGVREWGGREWCEREWREGESRDERERVRVGRERWVRMGQERERMRE